MLPVQFTPSTVPTQAASDAIAPPPAEQQQQQPAAAPELSHRKSTEALALDSRLDKISEWVKNVELIVQEARKAIAEGREMPLPLLSLPNPESLIAAVKGEVSAEQAVQAATLAPVPAVSATDAETDEEARRRFGVSPDKALPVHLHTSSTQVEPSTPPKWMTYAEAEERIKQANAWAEAGGELKKANKKERGSGELCHSIVPDT
jgi:hypothetical protein